MPANTNPIFPAEINTYVTTMTSCDPGERLRLTRGSSNGMRIDKILVFSNDPVSSHDVCLYLVENYSEGEEAHKIGTFNVPANAGVLDVPPLSLLDGPLGDVDGRLNIGAKSPQDIYYPGGSVPLYMLDVAPVGAVPAGIELTFLALAGSY